MNLLIPAPLPTSPTVVAGCTSDDDCPLYTACRDTRCINPCADENPCGRYASCRVINHRPECTCPDGFIGDPTTSCELRESPIYFNSKHFVKEHVCMHRFSVDYNKKWCCKFCRTSNSNLALRVSIQLIGPKFRTEFSLKMSIDWHGCWILYTFIWNLLT